MPTLHARIVAALAKTGKLQCRSCGAPSTRVSPVTASGEVVPVCQACWEAMCGMGQYAQAVHGHEEARSKDYPSYDASGDATLRIRLYHCANVACAPGPATDWPYAGQDAHCHYHIAPLAEAIRWYRAAALNRSPPTVRLVDSDYVIPDELSVDRPGHVPWRWPR